jgi:hypothetical protein
MVAWVLLCQPGHLQVDRLTTNLIAGILWHANFFKSSMVGVGLGYEILCMLSRKFDVGEWILLCRPGRFQVHRLKAKY